MTQNHSKTKKLSDSVQNRLKQLGMSHWLQRHIYQPVLPRAHPKLTLSTLNCSVHGVHNVEIIGCAGAKTHWYIYFWSQCDKPNHLNQLCIKSEIFFQEYLFHFGSFVPKVFGKTIMFIVKLQTSSFYQTSSFCYNIPHVRAEMIQENLISSPGATTDPILCYRFYLMPNQFVD